MKEMKHAKTHREHFFIRILGITAFIFFMLASTAGAETTNTALVYRGPAGCPKCSEAVAEFLKNDTAYNFNVIYVGPNEKTSIQDGLQLPNVVLYAQPGGDGSVSKAFNKLKNDAPAIRNFVWNGGRYLGICMGGYMVDNDPGFDLERVLKLFFPLQFSILSILLSIILIIAA